MASPQAPPRPPSRVPPPNYFLGATAIPQDMALATAKARAVRDRNQEQGKLVVDDGAYLSEFDSQAMCTPRGLSVLLNWATGNRQDAQIAFGAEDHYFDVIVNSKNLAIFDRQVANLPPSAGFPTLATCALWCRETKKMNSFNARITAREKSADSRLVPLARGQSSPLARFRQDACQIRPLYHDVKSRKHSAPDFQASVEKKHQLDLEQDEQ